MRLFHNGTSTDYFGSNLASGQTNHVRVEVVDRTVRAFVDGQRVLEFVDTVPARQGRIGFVVNSGAWCSADVRYDNVVVTSLSNRNTPPPDFETQRPLRVHSGHQRQCAHRRRQTGVVARALRPAEKLSCAESRERRRREPSHCARVFSTSDIVRNPSCFGFGQHVYDKTIERLTTHQPGVPGTYIERTLRAANGECATDAP